MESGGSYVLIEIFFSITMSLFIAIASIWDEEFQWAYYMLDPKLIKCRDDIQLHSTTWLTNNTNTYVNQFICHSSEVQLHENKYLLHTFGLPSLLLSNMFFPSSRHAIFILLIQWKYHKILNVGKPLLAHISLEWLTTFCE